MLNGQMDALGAADPLAALAALVQNGTSISTVVSTLAGQVADAVQRQLPAGQLGSGASRAQLVESIKAALSPPSNAPPGQTAAQETAALAQRLQTWLNGVAREAGQQAGQQSDRTGQVLDAKSARELPAQQEAETTVKDTGVSALASSLLASVAAALSASLPSGASSSIRPLPSTASKTAGAVPLNDKVSTIPSAGFTDATLALGVPNDASLTTNALQNRLTGGAGNQPDAPASTQPAATAAPQNGAQSPADLLARMLVRAARVDAQVNGASTQAEAQSSNADAQSSTATAVVRPPDSGGTATPTSTMTARLTALIAEAAGAAAESSGDGTQSDRGTTTRDDNARSAVADSTTVAQSRNTVSATPDTPAFAVPAAPPVSSANATVQAQPQAASTYAGASVDPNAVVEQVVKSMAMRTNANGTSEMRIRLEPENLGSVTLKLTVDGSSVSATAIAQNADVRSALMSHQHQLAKSLADSGLKLTGFSVDLSGGDARRDSQDRTSGFGRRYTVHETGGAEGSDSTESPASGPPLLPGSTVELLNYLA